jgi:hypothetical protein
MHREHALRHCAGMSPVHPVRRLPAVRFINVQEPANLHRTGANWAFRLVEDRSLDHLQTAFAALKPMDQEIYS